MFCHTYSRSMDRKVAKPARGQLSRENWYFPREVVGDISIIFPCSFAVGITQQYGIYVLLG